MMCDQREKKKRWMTRERRSWNNGDQLGLYEPGQSLVLRPHRTSKQNTKEEGRKAVYVCLYIRILAHPLDIPVPQDLIFTLDLLLTVALSAHVRAPASAGHTWIDDSDYGQHCSWGMPAPSTCPGDVSTPQHRKTGHEVQGWGPLFMPRRS